MKNKFNVLLFLLLPYFFWAQDKDSNQELMVCGDTKVIIFDVAKSKDTIPHIVWEWRANEAMDLPDVYREQFFATIDECKAVAGGTKILITSSSSGVALIERASQKVLFYARVGNAHSAEWLPNGRIVVAGSTNAKGNRLEVFDINQLEKPFYQDHLYSGHGVVWDAERQVLYALGYDELRAYTLQNWSSDAPQLKREQTWTIPGESGHDLMYLPNDNNQLLLTEHESVWLFDKTNGTFQPYAPLEGRTDVKGVSLHDETNRLAYIQAETSWWSTHVYLENPKRMFTFPNIRLYKTRWVTDRR